MSPGYFALVVLFTGMIGLLFAFAISELRRPRDPGPLPIDAGRDIDDRFFAKLLRRLPAAPVDGVEVQPPSPVVPYVVYNAPSGAASYRLGCHGDVPAGGTIDAFVSEGVASVGERAKVTGHTDGGEGLVVTRGARVAGRATSAGWILLEPESEVRFAAAPHIVSAGREIVDEPQPVSAWDEAYDVDLEWMLSEGMPLDQAFRALFGVAGRAMNAVEAVLAIERRMGLADEPKPISNVIRPSWMRDASAWYLGAATVRVRGDLHVPANATVPFHLVVEGNVTGDEDAHFHGSVHAVRRIALGERTRVEGSATARGAVHLSSGCSVGECVSAGRHAVIDDGVWIGGARHGGLVAAEEIVLGRGVVVRHKLYAERGAVVRSQPAAAAGLAH